MIDLKSYLNDHNLKLDINGVKPKFKCGICKDIICKPKTARCCCSFCETCITNFKNVNKSVQECPSCSNDFDFGMDVSDDFNKEMKIENLTLKCPKLFCKEEVILRDMKNHLESCANEGVRCILGGLGCSGVTETNEGMDAHVKVNLTRHLSLIVERMNRDEDCRVQQNQILLQQMDKVDQMLQRMNENIAEIKGMQEPRAHNQSELDAKYTDITRKHNELAQKVRETTTKQIQVMEDQINLCPMENALISCSLMVLGEIGESVDEIHSTAKEQYSRKLDATRSLTEFSKTQDKLTTSQKELMQKQIEIGKLQVGMHQGQINLTQKQCNLLQKQSGMLTKLGKVPGDIGNLSREDDGASSGVLDKLSELVQKQNEMEQSHHEIAQKLSYIYQQQQQQLVKRAEPPTCAANQPQKIRVSKRSESIDSLYKAVQQQSKRNFKLKIDPIFDKSGSSCNNMSSYKFAIKDIHGYNVKFHYFTNTIQLNSYNFKVRVSFEPQEVSEEMIELLICMEPGPKDDELEWPMSHTVQLDIVKSDGVHKFINTFSYHTAPPQAKHRYNKPIGNVYLKSFKYVKKDIINNDKSVVVNLLILK